MTPFLYALHTETNDDVRADASGYVLRLRLPEATAVTAAWVRSEPDNEQVLTAMRKGRNQNGWQVWEGPLELDSSGPVTRYAFKFLVAGRQHWLGALGISPYFPERDHHFRLSVGYEPARWVWSQVFYQIFPERFHDGDPSNNVRSGDYLYQGRPVVAKSWDELPDKRQGALEFFGGDLDGIREKLPYLEELGVSALYLNPIFASPSSHKYDTTDYYRVDPHFGGNESFARLCQALRERGMRVILDAVVNHTSERHPWFDRYGEHSGEHSGEHGGGAYGSAEAETRPFYVFQGADPESYHGWYGVKTLPVLDYASPELRRRIYEADDAVLRYWLRPPYSIDGWRFDVIHMLGEGAGARNNATYVRHFRHTLRQENPEAYVLGEHFFEATQWLQGDQEDAAMNYYGFTRPVTEFLARRDFLDHDSDFGAETFEFLLARARTKLPFPVQLSQFNLLDSHDTPRLLTRLAGDVALFKVALTLLMTYIGAPCLYYGDEVGLTGGHDPDCRRPFPWNECDWNKEILEHCRDLIRLRRETLALQEGAYLTLYAEGDAFAFARVLGEALVVVALTRADACALELPLWRTGLGDLSLHNLTLYEPATGERLSSQGGTLRVELAAKSSRVLLSEPVASGK